MELRVIIRQEVYSKLRCIKVVEPEMNVGDVLYFAYFLGYTRRSNLD